MKLSELIKSEREKQKKTVMGLALEADLSNAYVSDIENGNKRPLKIKTLKKLAGALGVPYQAVKDAVLESVSDDLGE